MSDAQTALPPGTRHPPMPAVIERDTDDEILAHSHELRKRIVKTITKDGTQIPVEDPRQMAALLQTLDGMDRQALGNKRIKVEEKANQTQEQAAGMIAQLLQKVTSQKPFEAIDVPAHEVRPAPQLPAEVPPPRLVEGETATVAPQQDYDTFVAQTSPNLSGERSNDS
jgi:hypothetical protein